MSIQAKVKVVSYAVYTLLIAGLTGVGYWVFTYGQFGGF